MEKSLKQIVDDIVKHIENSGGLFSSWYVDISPNPSEKLFSVHKVNKGNSLWIVKDTASERSARSIKKFIIAEFNTDGGTKDEAGKYIYAYRKTAATNP